MQKSGQMYRLNEKGKYNFPGVYTSVNLFMYVVLYYSYRFNVAVCNLKSTIQFYKCSSVSAWLLSDNE